MTNEFIHYEKISRGTWQSLHRKTTPPLTEEELDSIKSFNDQISLQDVTDIYLSASSSDSNLQTLQRRPSLFKRDFSPKGE